MLHICGNSQRAVLRFLILFVFIFAVCGWFWIWYLFEIIGECADICDHTERHRQGGNIGIDKHKLVFSDSWLADCPAMSFIFVIWHSRKWQPPIRGGLLQLMLLWLEEANRTDSFCKKGISYTNCGQTSKKQDKKTGKKPKKKQVFWRVFARFLPCCLHFAHLNTYNSDL